MKPHSGTNMPQQLTQLNKLIRYTEAELSSELLDNITDGYPNYKIVICTSPRSGSYLLCRGMIRCGLGIPHEYFNPIHIRDMGTRFGIEELAQPEQMKDDAALLKSYNKMLCRRRTTHEILGIKLQYWQYKMFLDNVVGDDFLRGAIFVHLYRSDILSQAISLHFARLTGKWGFDDLITTTPVANPNFYNFNAIDREIEVILTEHTNWRRFFGKNGIIPFEILYEELCSAPSKVLHSLSARMGIEDLKLSSHLLDEKRYESTENVAKADVREQYLSSNRRLIPALESV
jgi:trehalose 2-sulfotransferase